MKLISSKKTKRRIALTFVFAFMLSNLLSLIGPSAQAAVTITSPSAGTCFQHTGTVATGALVTVYNIGTIQVSLTAAEIVPGKDTAPLASANAAVARATGGTLAGSISSNSDVIGNVFSFVPPTGTNFVVVPGFQDTGAGLSNHILPANATISNATQSSNKNAEEIHVTNPENPLPYKEIVLFAVVILATFLIIFLIIMRAKKRRNEYKSTEEYSSKKESEESKMEQLK